MNNELNHYGVKGMRWGVRRFRKENGNSISGRKKQRSDNSSDAFRKPTKIERKIARASTKEMYKKLKRGEVLKGFDETTGQFLGFVDRKTGEPIKYSDVAAAQTYGAKKQAAAYIAAVGVLTVASVMAKLQE